MLLTEYSKKPKMKKNTKKKEISFIPGRLGPIFRDIKTHELIPEMAEPLLPAPNTEKTNLVYDKNTKIVYYGHVKSISETEATEELDLGHASTPYLSSNGNLCKFIHGRIVEFIKLR